MYRARLTWARRSGGIPSRMRIRIRAVPISSHNRSCNKRPGPGRRRRWSSPGFLCSRDTCSTSGAIRDPWRAPARRRRRHHRNEDSPCLVGPWLSRYRSRWYEEPHRCVAKSHSRYHSHLAIVCVESYRLGKGDSSVQLLSSILDQIFGIHVRTTEEGIQNRIFQRVWSQFASLFLSLRLVRTIRKKQSCMRMTRWLIAC